MKKPKRRFKLITLEPEDQDEIQKFSEFVIKRALEVRRSLQGQGIYAHEYLIYPLVADRTLLKLFEKMDRGKLKRQLERRYE